jgi:hypothetical protein
VAKPGAGVPAEPDVPARLDGLRGWLAELDRIVAIRTRVGLVLLAIGIGCATAAMYLAIDTRQDSASEDELRELRSDLEQSTEGAANRATDDSAAIQRLESQIRQLRQSAAGRAAGAEQGQAADQASPPGGGAPSEPGG